MSPYSYSPILRSHVTFIRVRIVQNIVHRPVRVRARVRVGVIFVRVRVRVMLELH